MIKYLFIMFYKWKIDFFNTDRHECKRKASPNFPVLLSICLLGCGHAWSKIGLTDYLNFIFKPEVQIYCPLPKPKLAVIFIITYLYISIRTNYVSNNKYIIFK